MSFNNSDSFEYSQNIFRSNSSYFENNDDDKNNLNSEKSDKEKKSPKTISFKFFLHVFYAKSIRRLKLKALVNSKSLSLTTSFVLISHSTLPIRNGEEASGRFKEIAH